MPCSVPGHSNPSAGPPQPCRKLPFESYSSTAGAARSLLSAATLRGRPISHTLSCLSTKTDEAGPSTQLFGTFGQDGSTWNEGTLLCEVALFVCPSNTAAIIGSSDAHRIAANNRFLF